MNVWLVFNTSRNPIGPVAMAYTDESVARLVKRVLGFNYCVEKAVVDQLPKLIKSDPDVEINELAPIVETEYDAHLKRNYVTIDGRWVYHPQGEGSSSRLVDKVNSKTYTVPHDEEFRKALEAMMTSLVERTT